MRKFIILASSTEVWRKFPDRVWLLEAYFDVCAGYINQSIYSE